MCCVRKPSSRDFFRLCWGVRFPVPQKKLSQRAHYWRGSNRNVDWDLRCRGGLAVGPFFRSVSKNAGKNLLFSVLPGQRRIVRLEESITPWEKWGIRITAKNWEVNFPKDPWRSRLRGQLLIVRERHQAKRKSLLAAAHLGVHRLSSRTPDFVRRFLALPFNGL